MPLIDGIGDEVVHFAAIVVVMAVAALAWWSTNARPDRYRTLVLMRSHGRHPVTVGIRSGAPPPRTLFANRQSNASGQSTTETVNTVALTVGTVINSIDENPSAMSDDEERLQEMDSIVDADMAMMENNRMHFYRRVSSPRATITVTESAADEAETQETEPASNAQIREMDSIVNAMEADVPSHVFSRPNGNDSNSSVVKDKVKKERKESDERRDSKESTPTTPEETNTNHNVEGGQPTAPTTDSATGNHQLNDGKILIRLKYLNDTLKEVEGSLDEMLKDFKRRHFASELSSEYLVRLIFNGHVLADEAASLRALGLHHRAVVHCLVHPRRTPAQRGGGEEAAALAAEGARAPERAWDLENVLMTLVSVALTVVWFFRCEYSNMFTASASVALFGLTVFYSVAIFGLYLSDTFHFDRRQPQPVPNN